MNSSISLIEDSSQRRKICHNDERILHMHCELLKLKKTRKGEYNMKDLRNYIPKLFNLTFRADADPNTLKAKGIWAKKPEIWPYKLFFGDPNNKNSFGNKPKEQELRPMFEFLMERFYEMYPKNGFAFKGYTTDGSQNSLESSNKSDKMFNVNYIISSPNRNFHSYNQQSSVFEPNVFSTWPGNYLDTSSSVHSISSINSFHEYPKKESNDYNLDENIAISINQAQSLNPEINAKYHELNNFLSSINHFLLEQSKLLLSYILTNLVSNDKIDLMFMLGIILNKIKKENGLTDETYNMIQNNFGDIIKQMYTQTQTNVFKNEENMNVLVDNGIDSEFIELHESNLDELSEIRPISDLQVLNNRLIESPDFQSNEYLLKNNTFETKIQNESVNMFNGHDYSFEDDYMNNMGVLPRNVNQLCFPIDMNNIGVLRRNFSQTPLHELSYHDVMEFFPNDDKMKVEGDHNYCSPQYIETGETNSNSIGTQIPSVLDFDERLNDYGRK